jgi:very-short-patch-repair endonuclease
VVSIGQLAALGLGRSAVTRRVQAGRLHRIHRGVYAVGHRALRVEGRRLAAVLACGPGAVLSHTSAAAHWGLLHTGASRIDVTAPRTRQRTAKIRPHRSRSLDVRDTTTHEAIPITTIARTLLDLAATIPNARLERAIATAHKLHLYDHTAIANVLERANGHRAAKTLAHATARDPAWTRNDFEAAFLALVRDAGLPEPLVNHPLVAPDHGHCWPDFLWPNHQVIVETDGWETHGTREAFEADRAKDAALTAAGFRVLRFTWRTDPATALRRVRTLLA